MEREMGTVSPNFIIGGVNNSGTSFLYSTLKQHPEVYMPEEMRPEPAFFFKSWEYKKGFDYYCTRWFSSVPKTAIAVGEKSTNYLFGGRIVAERMYKTIPDIKIIFILRNPIERAWANYRFTVLQGLEDLSFDEALINESERLKKESGTWAEIQPRNYTGRGYYAQKLKGFLSFFPRTQLLILKSESFLSDTDTELRKVYRFLGLTDLNFKAKSSPRYSSPSVIDPAVQMDLRNYFGDRYDILIERIREDKELPCFIQNHEDADAIQRLKENMKGEKERISPTAREYLSSLYADDMKELKSIVNFDIFDWG